MGESIERGLVRIATVTQLEIGYSARSGREARAALRTAPLLFMPVEYLTPAIEDLAVDVQQLPADGDAHRGASIFDLLIAATAELAGLKSLRRSPRSPCRRAARPVAEVCRRRLGYRTSEPPSQLAA